MSKVQRVRVRKCKYATFSAKFEYTRAKRGYNTGGYKPCVVRERCGYSLCAIFALRPSRPYVRCPLSRRGEITATLSSLHESPHGPIVTLLSHQETGHMASYARDKRVQRWCTAQGVAWQQFPQSGVRRHSRAEETRIGAAGLRDTWSKHWNAFIAAPQYPRISAAVLQHGLIRTLPSDGLQTAQQLAALGNGIRIVGL